MSDGSVTLTVDGKEVTVPQGTLIIRAAEQVGVEVPRFCDHPLLEPVGACRQCYVEIEGQRKLFTSCTTAVAPGMVVRTQNTSDEAHQAQVANLEFLLLNHPLDCPVCDRGGECPLQDQAMAFGPGESRYDEPKRVYEKPIALSPLVNLDRERCVLCARCTRFCDEISGDRFIELFARGAGERVAIAAGEDFASPFSGNTVQICPVGALTSTPYRFVARPFDLSSADSVCQHCSAGCNVKVDLRRGQVVRVLARDNLEVNDAWTCDKGRYAFRHPDLPSRVTTPLIRDHGLEPAPFSEVFERIAEWSSGGRVAFLAGGRLLDEDAYALSKLARTVFGTNDLDHRRTFHGGHAEERSAATALGTTYRDLERASVIVLAGLDAEQEVPILNLRIRKAVRRGAQVFVIHPRRTRLHDVAEHLLCRPEHQTYALERIHDGDAPADSFEARVAEALRAAGAQGVVLAGDRLAEHPLAADVAFSVAQKYGARFSLVPRRANQQGALRAGIHPSLLPGGRRVSVEAERAEVEAVWGGPIRPSRAAPAARSSARARTGRSTCSSWSAWIRSATSPMRRWCAAPWRTWTTRWSCRSSSASWSPSPTPSCRRRPGSSVTGTRRTGRGARSASGPCAIRPAYPGPTGRSWRGSRRRWAEVSGSARWRRSARRPRGLLEPREVPARATAWTGTGRPQLLGDLTLCTYPLLVDEGRLSEEAGELKAALGQDAFVEVHPDDAEKHGVADGGRAVVRTAAGEAELPVRVSPHVAAGTLFVPFNQAGLAANALLAGGFVDPSDRRGPGGGRRRGGGRLMDWLDWLLLVARVVVVFFALLIAVMLLIWIERKVIADMQTRTGPMRAGPRGVLITLADGIKLFFKEGITPTLADRPVYLVAPIVAMLPAFLAFAVIPFGTGVELFGREVPFQIADLYDRRPVGPRDGVVMVYSVVLAGWSSGLELSAPRRDPLDARR